MVSTPAQTTFFVGLCNLKDHSLVNTQHVARLPIKEPITLTDIFNYFCTV